MIQVAVVVADFKQSRSIAAAAPEALVAAADGASLQSSMPNRNDFWTITFY